MIRRAPWVALLLAACSGSSGAPTSSLPATPPAPATTTGATVGKPAPRFSVVRVPGPGRVELVPGKVNVVMFFATWHAPSQKAFPRLNELVERFSGKPFVLEALALDEDARQLPAWNRELEPRFDVGWDEGHHVAEDYRPPAFPTFFVVDRGGIVRNVEQGYRDGTLDQLIREIDAAF